MKSSVGLIDYRSGNLRSVGKALEREGAGVRLVSSPDEIDGMHALVLPGVGAFGDCVSNLRARKLWEPLGEWIAADKPFLGICLGYQLLFESSEESPGVAGFGLFNGRVVRFSSPTLKIPHMGWNTLALTQPGHPLWAGLPPDPYVFFVHSYFPAPEDPSLVSATSTYGERFAASIARGRIAAVQFHPEKSQAVGLTMLRNFIATLH